MPDEIAPVARVLARDGDAEAAAPAGHGAIGTGRRQRLDDRLDDLLAAMVGGERHRRPLVRPDHRPRLGDHLERAEGAVVLRRVRIDEIGERDGHRRLHVGEGRVDEADDLLMRIREVDLKVAAALGDGGADMDVLEFVAVVVEDRLALVDAVLPLRDDGAGLALGAVEHRLDRRMRRRPAELVGEGEEAPLADMGGADHRREIAAEVARMADIGGNHLHHVAPELAFGIEAQRRDADAFLPDLGGGGVVGAVGGAADIALMGAVDRPEDRLAVREDRHEGGEVGQMVAAVIGVVEQEDVAGIYVAGEEVAHRARRPGQGADMDRHMLGLGDEAAVEIADAGREIAAGVEDLRVGGAQHRLAHLLDDGEEAMLDDRDGDRIDGLHQLAPSDARYSIAAATPPLPCGTPASWSDISMAARAPSSMGSLRSPIWPMRKTRLSSLSRPPPSETLKRSRAMPRGFSASCPSCISTVVTEFEWVRGSLL